MATDGVTMEPSDREMQLPRRKKTDPQPALARWLRVWDANGDEVRMATLLNLALLMGGIASIVVPAFFAGMRALTSPLLVLGGVSLVGHGLGLFFNKRGAYHPVAATYVPFVFVLVALAILTGGGSRSSLWVFFVWPMVIATSFLSRTAARGLFLGTVLLGVGILVAEETGVYAPPWEAAAGIQREIPLFVLILLGMCAPLLGDVLGYFSATRAEFERAMSALQHHRASLELQARERTAEAGYFSRNLMMLEELDAIIALATDLGELLDRTVHLLSETFNAYEVMVFLADESGKRLVLEASVRGLSPDIQLHLGEEGIVGYATAIGRPYVATDVRTDPYYKPFPELAASASAAALPIILQGEVLGVVALESTAPDAFSEMVMEVLSAVTNVVGVAILNVRHLEQSRRLQERLSRYEQEEFLGQWRQLFARRQGRIGLLYDLVQVRPVVPEEGEALFGGLQPVQIEAQDRPDGGHVLLVPLNVGERTLGRMAFESDRPWREDERALVEAVTSQLGLALENARLLEATRRSALLEQTAGELTSRFRQQVEIEAVLQQALADLAQALGSERAAVRLMLEEEREGQA